MTFSQGTQPVQDLVERESGGEIPQLCLFLLPKSPQASTGQIQLKVGGRRSPIHVHTQTRHRGAEHRCEAWREDTCTTSKHFAWCTRFSWSNPKLPIQSYFSTLHHRNPAPWKQLLQASRTQHTASQLCPSTCAGPPASFTSSPFLCQVISNPILRIKAGAKPSGCLPWHHHSLLIWTSSPFSLLPDLYNPGLYKYCNDLSTHLCPTGLWVHSGNSPLLAFLASNSVWLTNDIQLRFANEFLIFILPWSAGSAASLTRLCWPLQVPFTNSKIMPHSQLSPHPCLF